MPQLASLSWFFISIFFISFLLFCCVGFWWQSSSNLVSSPSSGLSAFFNYWNW